MNDFSNPTPISAEELLARQLGLNSVEDLRELEGMQFALVVPAVAQAVPELAA